MRWLSRLRARWQRELAREQPGSPDRSLAVYVAPDGRWHWLADLPDDRYTLEQARELIAASGR